MKPLKSIPVMLFAAIMLLGYVLAADVPKAGQAKGAEESLKTMAPEAGESTLRARNPVDALGVYLDGFHFRNGHIGEQMEAHHFCSQLNEDLIQCVLYSANTKDALLLGVEYVISEKLFKTLPDDEKIMWHSHVYEVKSGMLVAPGLPDAAEHELMAKIISTYGKTWHTWNMESMGKGLPLGVPDLMMGFTADGQMNRTFMDSRDSLLGISSESKKKARTDIAAPAIQPGADAWQKGQAVELELKAVQPKK